MSDDWCGRHPYYGGSDIESVSRYGEPEPFEDFFFNGGLANDEAAAYWATLSLRQKIVGSLCSIAVGAGGAGLLIALFAVLH